MCLPGTTLPASTTNYAKVYAFKSVSVYTFNVAVSVFMICNFCSTVDFTHKKLRVHACACIQDLTLGISHTRLSIEVDREKIKVNSKKML